MSDHHHEHHEHHEHEHHEHHEHHEEPHKEEHHEHHEHHEEPHKEEHHHHTDPKAGGEHHHHSGATSSHQSSSKQVHTGSGGTQYGLWKLFRSLLMTPSFFLFPYGHRDAFKRSVGAARGNEAARQHMLRLLQSWILVGALLVGLFISLLDMGAAAAADSGQTFFDQLFGYFCIFGAVASLGGPIIMNSVMYLCVSSTSSHNYDILAAISRRFMICAELLTWGMIVACMFCFSLLPFVIFADRESLNRFTPALGIFNSQLLGWIVFGTIMALLTLIIYHINTLCVAAMHGGLFLEKRIENAQIWTGHDGSHGKVVDMIVRRALRNPTTEDLMITLSKERGDDPSEAYTAIKKTK
jgi:hypothetical protein